MSTRTLNAVAGASTCAATLHLALRVRSPQSPLLEVLAQACDALFEIKAKYSEKEDPLSMQLRAFMNAIFALEEELIELPPEDEEAHCLILDKAKSLIKQLQDSILVDSLYGMPLKKPVLEGEWVWDEEIFQTCRHCMTKSPLTGASFEAIEEHSFASKMLSFLRTLPQEFLLPTLHEADPEELYVPRDLSTLPPMHQEVRVYLLQGNCANFYLVADIAKATQTLDRAAEKIEGLRAILLRVERESQRFATQELEARRLRSEAHTQLVVTSIQAMKKAHRDERALLVASIRELRADLEKIQTDLREAEAKIEKDSQKISALEARCCNLQGQVNSLRVDDNGGCSIMSLKND